MYNNQL
jgi:hypothetical protein